MTYLGSKFEVATSNGLGGDTFTKDVTDGRTYAHTDGQRTTDRLWYGINIPFFLKKKAGVIKYTKQEILPAVPRESHKEWHFIIS